jgi:hypothetical protein
MLTASVIRAIALMLAAVSTPETSVSIYQNTRRSIQEDSRLHKVGMFENWAPRGIFEVRDSDRK